MNPARPATLRQTSQRSRATSQPDSTIFHGTSATPSQRNVPHGRDDPRPSTHQNQTRTRNIFFSSPARFRACRYSCVTCLPPAQPPRRTGRAVCAWRHVSLRALHRASVRRPIVARFPVRRRFPCLGAGFSRLRRAVRCVPGNGGTRRCRPTARPRRDRQPTARAGGAIHLRPPRHQAAVADRAFLGLHRRRPVFRPLPAAGRAHGVVRTDRAKIATSRARASAGMAADLAARPMGSFHRRRARGRAASAVARPFHHLGRGLSRLRSGQPHAHAARGKSAKRGVPGHLRRLGRRAGVRAKPGASAGCHHPRRMGRNVHRRGRALAVRWLVRRAVTPRHQDRPCHAPDASRNRQVRTVSRDGNVPLAG